MGIALADSERELLAVSGATITAGPIIQSHPEDAVVNAGEALVLSVSSVGEELSYQWIKDGEEIPDATGNTFTRDPAYSAEAGSYQVRVSNLAGSVLSAAAIVRVVQPLWAGTNPYPQFSEVGGRAEFSASAGGGKPIYYQWFIDGSVIAGATDPTLVLENVQPQDAGYYSVRIWNEVSELLFQVPLIVQRVPRPLSVDMTPKDAASYSRRGGTWVVKLHIDNPGESLSSLGADIALPEGWIFVQTLDGNSPTTSPVAGTTERAEFSFLSPPEGSFDLKLVFRYPAGLTGDQMFEIGLPYSVFGFGFVDGISSRFSLSAGEEASLHSADIDQNFQISLAELLRMIELYNARDGSERTGGYHNAADTPDQYAPGVDFSVSTPNHSADTNADGRVALVELLRVIELYNYREGSVLTGAYHLDASSVDGFAPGPAPQ